MKVNSPPLYVKRVTQALICSFLLLLFSNANAQALSGIKTVGPVDADYVSLTSAFNDLTTNGIDGNVILELQSGYVSTVEFFPLIIQEIQGANSSRTVTIRPEATATNLKITSTSANTVYLWSSKYIHFDGRPGGLTGASPELTISNTSTAGRAVYLFGDATSNVFRYCNITGVTASIASGVFTFGTGTTNGNDSNLVEYCTFSADSLYPSYLIYSAGSTTNANLYNSNNRIVNCKLNNFGGALSEAGAIKFSGGNTDWTITNNHIYQTERIIGTVAQTIYGINLNTTSNNTGNNHNISNNYIGGSQPFCGGGPWTVESTLGTTFKGIDLSIGLATPSTVWNNVINNFSWTTASSLTGNYGIWSGLWLTTGIADIRNNTIGSRNGSDSIVVTTTASGATVYGIGCHSTSNGTFNIENNHIGSIKTNGSTITVSNGLIGIYIAGAPNAASTFNITRNTIGSNTPKNMVAASPATTAQLVMGIFNNITATNTALFNITGNKIQGLHNEHNGTSVGQTIGIRSAGGRNNISNDTILNISNATPQTGLTLNSGVIGIILTSTAAVDQLINKNLIYGLTNTNATGSSQVSGIYYAATSATNNNIISNNFIHSLSCTSTSGAASIIGIDVLNGTASFQSNMIRLGINKSGGSILTGYAFKGINETGSVGNHFYHNSVYIGGDNVTPASNTYAFFSSATALNSRNVYNNIFMNNRSDISTGSTSNFAIAYPSTTNTFSNGNILNASGVSGKIGSLGAAQHLLFSDWVTQTSVLDGGSISAAPNFVNPTGDSVSVNLHIQSPTPAEGNGVPVMSVLTDFDGDIRSSVSPFDIGADAGNFTGPDLAAPSISYTDLGNTFTTADRVLTATISDASGVHTTGTLRPRAYFKKISSSTYASVAGTLVSGTNKEGQWEFTLTGSLISGFGNRDTIQYFVIAQDSISSPNISAVPAVIYASNVNTIINYPVSPKSYRILTPFQGVKNIGPGGDYPNLTGAFNDLMLNGIDGPLTLELLSSYNSSNESFPITIQAIAGSSSSNTIKIAPQAGATGLTITSATTATIDLVGATNVIIDGRVGGTGPANLTISNTLASGIAVRFMSDAVSNTLTYCNVRGINTSQASGIIYFGTAVGRGNDSNTVSYCDISSGASLAAVGVFSSGGNVNSENSNSDNIITNNTFHDIWKTTTESAGIKLNASNGGLRWTITNNSFYQPTSYTSTSVNHAQAIAILSGKEHIIKGNYIGGTQPLCGGSPWTLSVTTSARFTGINLQSDTVGLVVEDNIIANFNWQSNMLSSSASVWTGIGMGASGVASIRNNTIGSLTSNNSIVITNTANTGIVYGIASTSGTKGLFTIAGNKIGGFQLNTDAASKSCSFTGIYAAGSASSEAYGLTYHVDSNIIGGSLASSIVSTQQSTAIQTVIGIQNSVIRFSNLVPRLAIAETSGPVPKANDVYFKARYNTIQNLVNNHAGSTTGQTIGVLATAGVNLISKNTITNLWNKSPQEGKGVNSAVAGIIQSGVLADLQNITGNTIYNLFSDTATTTAVGVTGIAFSGVASGTNEVSANFIHHLLARSTNNASSIVGLHAILGRATYYNNMVTLGSDTSGADLPDFAFYGIKEDSGVNNYYHNSIHIGQIILTGISNTYAFYSNSSSTAQRSILNNIFSNQRMISSGTGMHYCISIQNNTNLQLNRNIYNSVSSGSNAIGQFRSTDYTIFSDWQSATNLDKLSTTYTNNFINPNGTSSLVNMHIQGTTPVEAGGTFIPEITTDIDGELRDTLSPVDIGADAGNFTAVDMFPPSISHSKLPNTNDTTNRIIYAQISDATGVSVMASAPRMFYRTGSSTSFVSVRGTLAEGTAKSGQWAFEADASLIPTGINRGDSVYYFFMAQDSTSFNYLASSPDGAVAFDVFSVDTAPATLYSYLVLSPMSGSYPVGSGHMMQNLTDTNGVFAYMQINGIRGDVELRITSDLVESGKFEFPVTPYKIKVVPSVDTVRNISGDNGTLPLIRLRGVRNVVIDGSYNGSGRYLKFTNTNINRPTIAFLNDATRDTITHCIIEGGNTSSYTIGSDQLIGVIAFNAALNTGNDSNCISHCYITGLPNQAPSFFLTSTGPSSILKDGVDPSKENDNNSIIYNEFVNQGVYALQLAAGTGENWDISHNSFYRTVPASNLQYCMQIYNGQAFKITNNNFGGTTPDRSGSPYLTPSSYYAINFQTTMGVAKTSYITGNRISNIVSTAAGAVVQAFLINGGKAHISDNIIGGGAMSYDSIIVGGSTQNDIITVANAVGDVTISNNTIGNIYYMGTNALRLSGITVNSGLSSIGIGDIPPVLLGRIENNTIRDMYNSGSSATDYTVGINFIGGDNFTVIGNSIYNLVATNTLAATMTAGVNMTRGTNHIITGNRIYNLKGSSLTPQIYGVRSAITTAIVTNNQIILGEGLPSESRVFGIADAALAGSNKYYYNSILLNGEMTGDNNSYGFYRSGAASVDVKNNLIYNKRTTTGTGKGYAFGVINGSGFSMDNINYNLAIVNDTTAVAEMMNGGSRGWGDFVAMYNSTHSTNWAELVSNVPTQTLFVDAANNNLNIDTTSDACWYVNGKGIRISNVTGDFNTETGIRSNSFVNGATDIGSHEFNTTTLPPLAIASPNGNSTSYSFGGRNILHVRWSSTGIAPSYLNVRYYSGTNPSNILAGKSHMNAYWDITENGGSGYTYDISMIQDSSIMGSMNSLQDLRAARYHAANWTSYAAVSNTLQGTFTAANLPAGFGIFTGTDGSHNPLPVKLLSFKGNRADKDVILSWTTTNESNMSHFVVEYSVDTKNWKTAGEVKATGTTKATTHYALTDANAFAKANTVFYRLKSVDNNSAFNYSAVISVSIKQPEVQAISVYPNPFSDRLTVTLNAVNDGIASISMMDITGRLVNAMTTENLQKGDNTLHIDANNLELGIYFLSIEINGVKQIIKVIKD